MSINEGETEEPRSPEIDMLISKWHSTKQKTKKRKLNFRVPTKKLQEVPTFDKDIDDPNDESSCVHSAPATDTLSPQSLSQKFHRSEAMIADLVDIILNNEKLKKYLIFENNKQANSAYYDSSFYN